MPEIFSVLFAALLPVAFFKLFFDDREHCRASLKHFCWRFGFEMIPGISPETNRTGFRFIFRFGGGWLLYYRLSS